LKKGIAFFDFDGTITTKDTLLEFIKFCKGNLHFYLGFLLYSPHLVAMKLKLISNQAVKEKVLHFFFNGTPVLRFNEQCELFTHQILPKLIRKKALDEIQDLQSKEFHIVIVSASPENWIRHWTNKMNIELMASKLEEKDGKITGKILGKNCHGDEKVRRIKEKHTIEDYKEIYAYGDTSGDLPMLKLATQPFYKPFR